MTSKEALECLQPFRWDDKKEIKAYEVLKELVERDTPKKVKIGTSKHFKFPICPNCKVELNEFYKNKYCKKCGQRLAWGESIYKENYLLLDEDTDIVTQINDYNNTVDIYNELEIGIKIKKQEKLLKLYIELSNYVDEQTYVHELPEITRLKILIKELEND